MIGRKKYIAATLTSIAAGIGIYMAGELTWPVFAVITLAVIALLGLDYFDGLKAGPIEVDDES